MAKEKTENKDIKNLKARIEKMKKHLEKNKHDNKTKRILQIKEAKSRKLEKYMERKSR